MRALAAEFGKLKRSRMILWTMLIIIGYTSIGLVTYPIIEDLMASNSAPMGQGVSELFAEAGITEIGWDAAMRFIPMGVSGAWGVMVLSLIAAYVFGREMREGTDVAYATLPVRRESFVFAKLVVIAVWAIGLALLSVIAQVGVDLIYLGTEGFRWSYVWRGFYETLYAMLPLYLTLPVIAWLSLTRKGYLRPMVFAVIVFTLSTGMVGMDAAKYFPWSMPIVLSGVTWMPMRGDLGIASWAIALAVFVIGLLAVIRRVNRPAQIA